MAYNNTNHLRKTRFIVDTYVSIKNEDIPDTYILKNEFPKHGIYISYRTWMNIKNMKNNQLPPSPQLTLQLA